MSRYLTNKLLSVFVLILISSTVFSQKKFINGFIINQSGDTIHGFINYLNWSKNPDIINFRYTIDGEIKKFTPLDIKAFGVLNEIYKSAIVKVDNSSIKTISETPVFEFRTDTIFLQTLIQDTKSLFLYKDKNDQENFYIFSNNSFELLEFKNYIKKDAMGHMFLIANKRYVGQLKYYLNDCPEIDTKLKNIEYTQQKIQALFIHYYSQKKEKIIFKRTNEKLKTEIGIIAGANMIDLKFVTSSPAFDPLPKAKFANTISPTAGLFINIVIPRNEGRWSIYNELVYSKYKTSAVYNNYYTDNNYQIHHYKVDFSYGKLNGMLRYKYPLGKLNAFVNAGFSFGFIVDEMNSDSINRQYDGSNTWEVENIITDVSINNPFESKKYELGALFGIGLNYKRFFTELRFEGGTGFTPFPALQINANRYNLLFGYKF